MATADCCSNFPFQVSKEDTFTLLIVNSRVNRQQYYYILNNTFNSGKIEECVKHLEFRGISYRQIDNIAAAEVYSQLRFPLFNCDVGVGPISLSLIKEFNCDDNDLREYYFDDIIYYPVKFSEE